MSSLDSFTRGYIYVLSNKSYKGIYKVGYTTRELKNRVTELSGTTGVPTPFQIEYHQTFSNCQEAEKHIHTLLELAGGRVASNREFFELPLKNIIETVDYVKSILENNPEENVTDNKENPQSKLYIMEAEEILKRELMFGGEKKAEVKLIEAAKLGDPEAYYLLGNLYSNSSLDSMYDIERASNMYLKVIEIEGLELDKDYIKNSYNSLLSLYYFYIDELVAYKKELNFDERYEYLKIDELFSKTEVIEDNISTFQDMLKEVWNLYIKAFETNIFPYALVVNVYDFIRKLKEYLYNKNYTIWNVYLNQETRHPEKNSRLTATQWPTTLINSISYLIRDRLTYTDNITKEYWQDESRIIKEIYELIQSYNNENQLKRSPVFEVLSVNKLDDYKVDIKVRVIEETIEMEDTFTIAENYYSKNIYELDNILFVNNLSIDNKPVDRLNENEVGTVTIDNLYFHSFDILKNNNSSLKIIGNTSKILPETTNEIGSQVNKETNELEKEKSFNNHLETNNTNIENSNNRNKQNTKRLIGKLIDFLSK